MNRGTAFRAHGPPDRARTVRTVLIVATTAIRAAIPVVALTAFVLAAPAVAGADVASLQARLTAPTLPPRAAFLRGRIDSAALLAALCATKDRRSTGAMCDDDSARVRLAFERERRAYWMALGPGALWAARRRGEITPEFGRRMHAECFASE